MVNSALHDEALRIGRQLCQDAVWSAGKCRWIDERMRWTSTGWRASASVVDESFAGGVAGIAWFLSQLGAVSNDAEILDTAQRVQASSERHAHTLLQGDAGRLADAIHRVDAGGAEHVIDDVAPVVDRLMAWATHRSRVIGARDIGLCRGASGISLSLAAWAARTGRDDLLDEAVRVARLERQALHPVTGWCGAPLDGWVPAERVTGSVSSGAAGIAIARFGLYRHRPEACTLAEAAAALEFMCRWLSAPVSPDATLGSGVCGAIEALLCAYEVTGEATHLQAAHRLGERLVSRSRANGAYDCGLGLGVQPPGLATGLAGIGVTLLRLATDGEVVGPMGQLLHPVGGQADETGGGDATSGAETSGAIDG